MKHHSLAPLQNVKQRQILAADTKLTSIQLLDEEVRSGRLPKSHLFYRLVLKSLIFATEVGNAGNQFKHDPLVRSFCDTIKRSGHWWTFNLLTGKRMPGKGRGSSH